MTDLDKLRVLLPHWIAHNREHGGEFIRWIDACEGAGRAELVSVLREAATSSERTSEALEQALALMGGPLHGEGHGHHHGHTHGHDEGHQ